MSQRIETKRASFGELERGLLVELCLLWQRVWPREKTLDGEILADDYVRAMDTQPFDEGRGAMLHYCLIEGQLVSAARSFRRLVRFCGSGRVAAALALAGVCSHPERRGRGWGRAVVEDAFLRLDEAPDRFEFCLFQTGSPTFYERLGACLASNAFVDSSNAESQTANPWWDPHAMVFPGAGRWEQGRVDLQGPGY